MMVMWNEILSMDVVCAVELAARWCNKGPGSCTAECRMLKEAAAPAIPVPHTPGPGICSAQVLCRLQCHLLAARRVSCPELPWGNHSSLQREGGDGSVGSAPLNASLKGSLSGAQSLPEFKPHWHCPAGEGRSNSCCYYNAYEIQAGCSPRSFPAQAVRRRALIHS